MADDPTPTWSNIAKLAGEHVGQMLERGLSPRRKTDNHLTFKIEDFDTEKSSNERSSDLRRAMKHFENNLLEERHPESDIEWRIVFVITKTVPLSDTASTSAPSSKQVQMGDVWFLAISSGGEAKDKIGSSFNAGVKFPVMEGDSFIAYMLHKRKND
ncbi:hypothetical protein Q7P35_005553 [Cladosporium inversicolor]